MMFLLFVLPLFSHRHQKIVPPPKIYDCFMFYNELDMLEIRLNEMYDYVDFFVLVESTESHQGREKRLVFEEHKSRFERFRDKIIHVVVADRLETDNLWVRENYQRNQIMRGLNRCFPDDIVIVSDVDEVIRGKELHKIVEYVKRGEYSYVGCQLDLFIHYMNSLLGQWNGPVISTFRNVEKNSPQFLRDLRNQVFHVPNAGWHFSSAGGVDVTIVKNLGCVHGGETNRQKLEATRAVVDCIPIDSEFPQYVIDHREEYISKGLIKEECTSSRLLIGQHLYD